MTFQSAFCEMAGSCLEFWFWHCPLHYLAHRWVMETGSVQQFPVERNLNCTALGENHRIVSRKYQKKTRDKKPGKKSQEINHIHSLVLYFITVLSEVLQYCLCRFLPPQLTSRQVRVSVRNTSHRSQYRRAWLPDLYPKNPRLQATESQGEGWPFPDGHRLLLYLITAQSLQDYRKGACSWKWRKCKRRRRDWVSKSITSKRLISSEKSRSKKAIPRVIR